MHPIHHWFIHDLRAYKAAMEALAAKIPDPNDIEPSGSEQGGYRPLPDVTNDIDTLATSYLEASGYRWSPDVPSKLEFLLPRILNQRHLSDIQKLPDFAFRIPERIRKWGENHKDRISFTFMIIVCIIFSPILVPTAVMLGAWIGTMWCFDKVRQWGLPHLGRLRSWGLNKVLPANQPSSRVLGTETAPKSLEA